MSTINNLGDLASALEKGQSKVINKDATGTITAGRFVSCWQLNGDPGAGAASPANPGSYPDNTTQGAIKFNNAGAGLNHLLRLALSCGAGGVALLYDRVWSCGSLSGAVFASPQTAPFSAASSRWTAGDGLELWLDCLAAPGTTTRNVEAAVTTGGGSLTATAVLPATFRANECVQFGGVNMESLTAVASFNILAGSTGGAGNLALTVRRPLGFVPLNGANLTSLQSALETAEEIIPPSACLELMIATTANPQPALKGLLKIG